MANVTFEIKETIAVLSKGTKGWQRELNVISWNGATPKYDIRDWNPDHDKMGKGITLDEIEANLLFNALMGEYSMTKAEEQPAPEVKAEEQPVPEVKAEPQGDQMYTPEQLKAIERARAMMGN